MCQAEHWPAWQAATWHGWLAAGEAGMAGRETGKLLTGSVGNWGQPQDPQESRALWQAGDGVAVA